jgi:hypothetical protein
LKDRLSLAPALGLLTLAATPALAHEDCAARPTQVEVTQCTEAAWRSVDELSSPEGLLSDNRSAP